MSIRMPNSCFIHVPRTGGLWFGEVVRELGIKHQVLKGDIDSHFKYCELPHNWRALVSFGFIRHPFDWVKSRWSHAIEHNVVADYRHYGVHRLFDECVRPTFKRTLETILSKQPGLVGLTYLEMLTGVDFIYCTEDLPIVAFDTLKKLEGVVQSDLDRVSSIPAFNGTSKLDKWQHFFNTVPESLVQEFLASESLAITMWNENLHKE